MANSHYKIYSSKEIEALFRTALETDQPLIPYLALAAFAGLRKMEIENLRLTDVDFEAWHISVSCQRTKKLRIIYGIPEAVWLWLAYARDQQLANSSAQNLSRQLNQLFKKAGVGGNPRDLRLSFAGHLYAINGDEFKVANLMGQPPAMHSKHGIFSIIMKSEAAAYFAVTPSLFDIG